MACCGEKPILAPLKSFRENMQLVEKQIKEGDPRKRVAETFDIQEFWRRIEVAFQGVSREATKLSLAFSKPPEPQTKECAYLVGCLEASILAVVSTFYNLSSEYGDTLRKSVSNNVLDVVRSVQVLASSIIEAGLPDGGVHQCSQQSDQLLSTGSVWSACDSVSQLPRDNKAAVLAKMESVSSLVKDALEELEEVKSSKGAACSMDALELSQMDSGDEESDVDGAVCEWSDEDERMVAPCTGLVKAAKSVLKKVSNAVELHCRSPLLPPQASELDHAMAVIEPLSERVDELVSSVYVPVDRKAVWQNAAALSDVLQNVLTAFRGLSLFWDDDHQWTEFLSSAIKHNIHKLNVSQSTACS